MSKSHIPKSVTTVKRILNKFFTVHDPLKKDIQSRIWILCSHPFSKFTSDNKNNIYTIWPFPIKKELEDVYQQYPLYFSFNIKIKENDEIDGINIKIFKEDITKIEEANFIPTELLLRVEWSNSEQQDNSKQHAQPHWHIHSYKNIDIMKPLPIGTQKTLYEMIDSEIHSTNVASLMDDDIIEDKKERNELIIPPSKKDIPFFKFHLAMLAEWDKSKKISHNKILTDDILKIWLPECLQYIQNQLEYIYKKCKCKSQ